MDKERKITISNRHIGDNYPPVVIAEIGINHEGSLKTALEMVDAAHSAGAEIIKHQTHIVEDEMCSEAKKVIPGNADVSIYDIMARCSLSEDDEIALKKYVESKNMIFLSTPFSRAAANRLEKMGVSAYKIGSGEMNNYPLIEHIASFGKPMIVSTGMNNIDTIKKCVEIMDSKNVEYALMHTTNLYPTPVELVRLGAITLMLKEFPGVVIGLSDHTLNNNASLAAVALGADIIERHFTDSKERTGPDIVCSMTPDEMKSLIIGSTEIKKMRGGKKEAAIQEQVTIDFAYASIVSIKSIQKGDTLTKENVWVKRPGKNGIPAEQYEKVIGKKARVDIENDVQIKWEWLL